MPSASTLKPHILTLTLTLALALALTLTLTQVRHYDRGSMLKDLYLVEDNSSCIRPPPPGSTIGPPG